MYKVTWDKENNGIILSDKIPDNQVISPPRPVFFEELDLLGFDKHWEYPKSDKPLLWAIGRKYYYKGLFVAEAKGGNIYNKPCIRIEYQGSLKPININNLLKKNKAALNILEDEAIDFIQDTYKKNRSNIDYFSVAFSGGKDSQVVLDLVSRVLAPNEYVTIFSDTDMEIPFTYATIQYTKEKYKRQYPEFKFYIASPEKKAEDYWKEFGPPSRIHRWCCSVCKTVPFVRFINKLNGTRSGKNPRILVFEGVRREESNRRSNYTRITYNVKGTSQINAEIILNWNLIESHLYLMHRGIKINKGYRYGLNRVGCSICPFGSTWSEFILSKIANKEISPFLKIITSIAEKEVKGINKVTDFIEKGQWKIRAGGRNLKSHDVNLNLAEHDKILKAIIENPREDIREWIKIVGDVKIKYDKDSFEGEIENDKITHFSSIKKKNNKFIFQFRVNEKDRLLFSKLKKILNKTTYCIHCGACEIECPTGALRVNPTVKINSILCVHCHKCIDFTEKGCLLTKSISITEGVGRMHEKRIATSKYQTFGLRNEWLTSFMNEPEQWIEMNKLGIGNRQIQSIVAWLKDCEFLDKTKNVTELALLINKKYNKNELILWSIVWINLFYNVNLIKWFTLNINWGERFSTKELVELIVNYDTNSKIKTTSNAVNSLVNMFANSPLNEKFRIGKLDKKSNIRYVSKIGSDEIHPITIAYSLYKYAEHKKRYNFTVSEIYRKECDGGPYKQFGISKEKFENILRGLQENRNQIVKVDLTANLDNIFLREDVTSIEVLKLLSE